MRNNIIVPRKRRVNSNLACDIPKKSRVISRYENIRFMARFAHKEIKRYASAIKSGEYVFTCPVGIDKVTKRMDKSYVQTAGSHFPSAANSLFREQG